MSTVNRSATGINDHNKTINVLDIIKYLLHHWKWFVLSVLIFGSYYYYQYSKSTFVYRQTETVMIKTPANTPTSARVNRSNALYNMVNVASEILQLRSKELMRNTVSRVGADISYSIQEGLRTVELYKDAPFRLHVEGVHEENYYSLTAIPQDKETVLLTNFSKGDGPAEIKAKLGDTLNTPVGKMILTANPYYSDDWYGKEIHVQKFPREQMAAYFGSRLNIAQMESDASLLEISIEDSSPKRAADIITTLITVYNEFAVDTKNQIAENTADFIHQRLAIIESELGSVEGDIERLQTRNQGIDIGTAGQMYLSDSRQYQAERSAIETDLKLAEMMRDYLVEGSQSSELIPNNTGLVDANIETQISAYNNTLLRRNRLTEGSSSENPIVQDLESTLASMRSSIQRAVDNAIAGLEIKMANVRQEEAKARGQVMQIPQKQRTMLSIERQQKVKEELYVFLLNKREENALNQAMTEDNMTIIDPASGSTSPIAPSRFRKLALGIGIGLILPAVILLLKLMLDTGIRDRRDIENATSVPFLGEIPFMKNRKGKEGDVLVSRSGRDPLTEAFRILRTNINFMAKGGVPPQVIVFTSFSVGVGKTFSVLNLASTLSYLDKKVVVLDLDLRKGTLSGRIGLNQVKGSSHFLSDQNVSVDDIIHTSELAPNMDVVPIGVMAPNPVELLLSKRLDDLIRELKERYDYVVVDGVPMGIVADASIADRISDLTLFVIRVGKMDRRQLPELERVYKEARLSNLAVVLNGLKLGGNGYGGGYGYGGYGYGYGYDAPKSKFALFSRLK